MTALDALKAHLRITGTDDDALLTQKLGAASAAVTNDIGADAPVSFDTAAADLQEAILLRAAHMFENAEPVLVGISAEVLPLGYADLIAPYRKWVF